MSTIWAGRDGVFFSSSFPFLSRLFFFFFSFLFLSLTIERTTDFRHPRDLDPCEVGVTIWHTQILPFSTLPVPFPSSDRIHPTGWSLFPVAHSSGDMSIERGSPRSQAIEAGYFNLLDPSLLRKLEAVLEGRYKQGMGPG